MSPIGLILALVVVGGAALAAQHLRADGRDDQDGPHGPVP